MTANWKSFERDLNASHTHLTVTIINAPHKASKQANTLCSAHVMPSGYKDGSDPQGDTFLGRFITKAKVGSEDFRFQEQLVLYIPSLVC